LSSSQSVLPSALSHLHAESFFVVPSRDVQSVAGRAAGVTVSEHCVPEAFAMSQYFPDAQAPSSPQWQLAATVWEPSVLLHNEEAAQHGVVEPAEHVSAVKASVSVWLLGFPMQKLSTAHSGLFATPVAPHLQASLCALVCAPCPFKLAQAVNVAA
jgi:hypothetical protein